MSDSLLSTECKQAPESLSKLSETCQLVSFSSKYHILRPVVYILSVVLMFINHFFVCCQSIQQQFVTKYVPHYTKQSFNCNEMSNLQEVILLLENEHFQLLLKPMILPKIFTDFSQFASNFIEQLSMFISTKFHVILFSIRSKMKYIDLKAYYHEIGHTEIHN